MRLISGEEGWATMAETLNDHARTSIVSCEAIARCSM
jgi:hypothetical protein